MSKKAKIITISTISIIVIAGIIISLMFFLGSKTPQSVSEMTDIQIVEAKQEIVQKDYQPVTDNEEGKTFEIEKPFYGFENGKYVLQYNKDGENSSSYYYVPNAVVIENGEYSEEGYFFDEDDAKKQMDELTNQIENIAKKLDLTFFQQYNVYLNGETKVVEKFTKMSEFLDEFYKVNKEDQEDQLRFITYVFKDKNDKQYVFTISKVYMGLYELSFNLS